MSFHAGLRVILVAVVSAFFWMGCGRETPRRANADARDAKLAQLEKENERLRAERQAAQQSSAVLDATLRSVEEELGALVGMDSKIRELQHGIEGGMSSNAQSTRTSVRRLIERLKTALRERQGAIRRARSGLDAAKKQVTSQPDANVKEAYIRQVAQLETIITQQVSENERLTRERDSYERLYRRAEADAKDARAEAETVKGERDEERRQREEAERLQNRVFVVSATKGELRQKGVLTGRWYQRKSSNCACADCLAEEDRRTLTSVPVPAPAKRVTVYSSHPAGSFRVVANGPTETVLEIVDAEKFWSGSHCLVIGY